MSSCMVTSKNEFAYFQKTAFYYLLVQYSTYEMKGVRMQDRLVNFSFESLSFHVISTTTTYHSLHLRSSGRAVVSPPLSPYSASKVEASPAITSFPILMFIFSGPGKGERRNAIKSHGERGLFFLTRARMSIRLEVAAPLLRDGWHQKDGSIRADRKKGGR